MSTVSISSMIASASSVERPDKSHGSHRQLTSTIPRRSNDEHRYASSSWLHRTNTRSRNEVGLHARDWIKETWHLSKHDFRIPNEFWLVGSTVMNGSFFRFVGLAGSNMTLSKRERKTYGGGPHQQLLIMRRGSWIRPLRDTRNELMSV